MYKVLKMNIKTFIQKISNGCSMGFIWHQNLIIKCKKYELNQTFSFWYRTIFIVSLTFQLRQSNVLCQFIANLTHFLLQNENICTHTSYWIRKMLATVHCFNIFLFLVEDIIINQSFDGWMLFAEEISYIFEHIDKHNHFCIH